MDIVIKIPKEYYDAIKAIPDNQCGFDMLIIKNGTPLPKGHGRLIDENDLKTLYGLDYRLWWGNAVEEFTDLPTIIEADKGE